MAVGLTVTRPTLWPLAGALLALAGLLILVRLWRWAPWRLWGRPDLLALLLGYAWLGVGAWLVAADLLAGSAPATRLHGVTIGGLGTLASGIMLRQAILRARGHPADEPWLAVLAVLFALAAGLRLAMPLTGSAWQLLLWGAAGCWSLAWLLVAWRLRHWARRAARRTAARAATAGT